MLPFSISRPAIREIGYILCMVIGFMLSHLWETHKADKKEIRILNTTVATYQSADKTSLKAAEKTRNADQKLEAKGNTYVESKDSPACIPSDSDARLLNDVIEEANSSIGDTR